MMKKYPLMRAALLLLLGTLLYLTPFYGHSQVTCSFVLQQTNNCAPKPILATATASTPSPYVITQYCWRLKNCATGTIIFQACGPNNTFSYVDIIPGNVCLTLTAFNNNGDSCTSTVNNIIVSDYPHIDMTFGPLEFCCPQVVTTGSPCQITTSNGTIDSLVIQPGCGPIKFFNNCPNTPIQLPFNCVCPPGYYDITVIAKNTVGCYADTTYNDIIRIIAPPVASFTETNAKSHCASGPLTVNFTATNAGPNMTYQWIVDGVVKQTAPAPAGLLYSETFPISANCHNVWLVVSHPSGCTDTLKKNDLVCVTSLPVVAFSQNITTACVNASSPATLTLTDTTTGGPHTISWSLSGGTPNTNFPVFTSSPSSYTIVNPGTYTVTVTASFGPGCNSTISQQVLVANTKPVADFSMNDTVGCKAPFVVTYTATPCAGCTYNWSFPGGTPTPQTGQTVTTTYTNFTTNPVNSTLNVQVPGSGCSASITKTLTHLKRLRPAIGLNHIRGCAPLTVQLSNLTPSFPGEIIDSVCWSFPGSLITSTCSNLPITKVFSTTGCYDVMLYVTTQSGCRDSLKLVDTICVSTPPICTATANPDTMCFEEDSVHFSVLCDSVNLIFADFGDFTQGYYHSGQFDHMYSSYGPFIATLITYRDSCVGDTFKLPITVFPPAAKFKDSASCGLGDTVYLVNQTKGANRWMWHFCNGDSSNVATPTIRVPNCDSCKVDIVAYNDTFNCVHKYEKTFSTPCDSASVSPSQISVCAPKSGALPVTLTNTSPNSLLNLTSWDLNYGPGITYQSTGPSHTFPISSTGVFDIAMRNISASQCTTVVHATITSCRITTNFGPLNACMPAPVQFYDASIDTVCGITKWRWYFGDGGTDTIGNPLHAYPAAGSYQCKLVVENSLGCRDSITKTVTMGNLVNFNYRLDTIVCPGHSSCVTNSTTGVSLTWQWNLVSPGGSTSTYNTAAPCFSLPTVGDYKVYMQMQSGSSCTKYDTFTIHVAYPTAAGSVSTDTLTCPNPPQVINFTNLSQYWDSTVTWDFGDGNFSPISNATHIYSQPGSYEVKIITNTNDGCSAMAIVDTIVIFGPDGNFDYSPKPGICACKDSVDYTISTINATDLTLIWGCSSGFTTVNNLTPGTVNNPTIVNLSIPYCKTDTCQPQLIFEDATGCLVYRDLPYIWIDSPVVKFTFDSYGVCERGNVCFQDITSYTLPPDHSWTVQRFWDFGDPGSGALNFDTSATPCHYYDTTGGYNVKLYIRSNLGCYDSIITNLVVISEYPRAGFYGDDTLVCAYSPACFHDTSWIYPLTAADFRIWNWGDGTRDTVHSPDACHIYTTGGLYRVTMTVWDSAGCPDADSSIYIRVVDNPIANAGGDQTICYGTVTQLNGTGTSNCFWTGPVSNPNSCNPTIQLFQDDSVTLIVTDQYNCADTSTAHFTVARVFADFTVGATFCSDDSICVTDATTNLNGTITDWRWDFANNGPLLHGANVCSNYHNFPQGTYTIELLATDNHGCVDSTTKQVSILPSPSAAFSLNDTIICSDQQLCITDLTTSQTAISSWQWLYGDFPNTPVNGNNPPCHTYAPPFQTNYTVQLVVTDQNNCRDTAAIVVTLNKVPTANFTWSASCESTPMQFSSNNSTAGSGALNFCEWTFWQGALNPVYDNNCNPSFQFPAGQYPVQFVIGDVNGCKDTVVQTVSVDSISQLVIYPGDTTICAGSSVDYNVSGVFDQIVWTPNVWISNPNSTTVTVSPLANIGYIISAVNGVCAAASDTFSIRVLQPIPIEVNATPDQIVLGLTSNLTSQIPGQIDSIIWTPAGTLDCYDCPNPIATPITTTTYTATIYYSENGTTCTNSAQVTITVLNNCDDKIVYVPNTFTPNGDGLNDIFMIRGLAATKINYFRIFDRWGHMVFEAQTGAPNEPKWGWDGTDLSGQKLNNGVFVYTYEIECINGETVHGQGNVTLVR